MSECRFFPLCGMSDERCEASAQCAHYEPMPEVVRCRDCGRAWIDLFDENGGFAGKANVGVRIMLAGMFYVPERACRNVHGGREFECSECGTTWHLLSRGDALAEWEHVRDPNFCPSCGARVIEEES